MYCRDETASLECWSPVLLAGVQDSAVDCSTSSDHNIYTQGRMHWHPVRMRPPSVHAACSSGQVLARTAAFQTHSGYHWIDITRDLNPDMHMPHPRKAVTKPSRRAADRAPSRAPVAIDRPFLDAAACQPLSRAAEHCAHPETRIYRIIIIILII